MTVSPQVLIQRGAQRFGPYAPDEVLTHHGERRLFPTDLAWHEGLAAWEPLGALMARLGSPLPVLRDADGTQKWLIPVGRSGWAIAAGYLGLFSVLFVFAPFALVCGIMALRSLRRNPQLVGKGRAWFGIVMGGVFSALMAFGLLSALFQS
ncbi:MAG: DUF4190 domain-containing protein [Burkholderiales bacterium]|nr:DUF4190 domain-containing protein [Opitutaceae bacterium]